MPRLRTIAVLAAGLFLSACAGGVPSAKSIATAAAPPTVSMRDLGPDEKKAIIAAVAPNLKNPSAAKYHWVQFPTNASGDSVNYCATVDADSPYAPYDGRQAYIVELDMSGNHITSADMGLIAGGKDAALVSKLCAKYGLDPFKSS